MRIKRANYRNESPRKDCILTTSVGMMSAKEVIRDAGLKFWQYALRVYFSFTLYLSQGKR
ncbi:MAG: hypothetical protein QW203_08070 [Thermoplasmatales archaeon]